MMTVDRYEDPDWIEVRSEDGWVGEVYAQTSMWAQQVFDDWLNNPVETETELIRKVRREAQR